MKKKLPKTAKYEFLQYLQDNPPEQKDEEKESVFAWDEVSTVL